MGRSEGQTYSDQFLSANTRPKMVGFPYLVAVAQTLTPEPHEYIKRVTSRFFDFATIDKLISCESGWNPKAKHLNPNGTWDIGLWQINMTSHPSITMACAFDVQCSTNYALKLLKSERGLGHWVCYNKL